LSDAQRSLQCDFPNGQRFTGSKNTIRLIWHFASQKGGEKH